MHVCLALHLLARLDESHGGHALELVAEVVAHCRLKHLVDQIAHRADHRYDSRRARIRDVNLNLKLEFEYKSLAALGHNVLELRVEIMRFRNDIRPVQRQDGRGHDLRRIAARVDGIFAGAQWLLPDAAMAGSHKRAKLEFRAGRIFGDQAHIRLHNGNLTLAHHEHGNHLHAHEERIQGICAVEQKVVLKADVAAVVEEGLVVLIVVVQAVFRAEKHLDDGRILAPRLLHVQDVGISAQPPCDVARGSGSPS